MKGKNFTAAEKHFRDKELKYTRLIKELRLEISEKDRLIEDLTASNNALAKRLSTQTIAYKKLLDYSNLSEEEIKEACKKDISLSRASSILQLLGGAYTECSPKQYALKGYSSHGVYTSLSKIFELELERGNKTAEDIQKFLLSHPEITDNRAIWVTYRAQECLTKYCHIPDIMEQSGQFNLEDILNRAEQFVTEVDLTGMMRVCSDEQDGYLYVRK